MGLPAGKRADEPNESPQEATLPELREPSGDDTKSASQLVKQISSAAEPAAVAFQAATELLEACILSTGQPGLEDIVKVVSCFIFTFICYYLRIANQDAFLSLQSLQTYNET